MTAPERPAPVPRLYGADSMLFIYHFENNKEFGEAAGARLARTRSSARTEI